jgi:phenylpropionate dioxygenase-like ring-hydroxylating dioxygenase large terminal subunit
MKHYEQVRLIRAAFAAIDCGRPPMTKAFTSNDPRAYTSAQRAAREREILFGGYPIVAGFSSDLAHPGDFITEDLAPVPILVVRGADGALRAFANVCRHRGARVVTGCGHGAARFACPYHAWTYDSAGRLIAIPDEFGFEGMDHAANRLIEYPVAEKYGLVWVRPAPDSAAIDPAEIVGGLGDDLDSYGIASFAHQETRVVRRRINWKLVSDTFWEAYHIKVLHAANVGPLFVKNLALFDAFGQNHRYVGIRKSIEKLRGLPEEKWDLVAHATILMNLFPNTILVMQTDHAEIYRTFPAGDGISESVTAVTILAPAPSPKWARTMDLLLGVVEQDFAVGEGIQRNFESGVIAAVNYGRYEQALEHFHRSIRAALGEE